MRSRLFVLVLTFFTFLNTSFAQDEGIEYRIIPSITDWLEEINNFSDKTYYQKYIRVLVDSVKDQRFISRGPDVAGEDKSNFNDVFEVNKKVSVSNFSFGQESDLYRQFNIGNIRFKETATLFFLENSRLVLNNISFEDKLFFRMPDTRFYLNLENCEFRSDFIFTNPTQPTPLNISNCSFHGEVFIAADGTYPTIIIENSEFFGPILFGERSTIKTLLISDSKINSGIGLRRITLMNSLEITNSEINLIDIEGIDVPVFNTYLPFHQIENKLVVFRQDSLNESSFYRGQTEEDYANKEFFDRLISSYSKLLNIYKARSEMESYNTCYVEMKDMQTARSKYIYNTQPSFSTYFDHKIYLFMRVFSDYGTRPAKALLIFFQVVMAFAVFYFFFPSKWNNTDNGRVLKWFTMIGKYFTSDKNLSGIYDDENVEQYESFEEFRDFLVSSKKELPAYFQLLRKPLYALSVVRYNTTRFVLKNVDILNGRWVDLPRRKRLIASILTGVYLFLYLVYAMLIRAINAITLSLNAFSTLGFGEIPTKGLARYIVIIQGFLGWFLLSIFLVSLIGQILN